MGKKKNRNRTNFILLAVGIALVLILALWVWPTFQRSPDISAADQTSSFLLNDQHIDTSEAYQKIQEGAYLLDVRTEEEWNASHIPGATLIPLDQLSNRFGELPPDQEIVIYCRSGNRSGQALTLLTDAGILDIYSMDGGINDWISAGYEVITGQ
jgi:rhodanese-related sulfurtransferase